MDKAAGTPTGATAGSTIPYAFTVTNSGNVTLSGVAISDTQLDAAATCAATTLAPGASTTCTGTHTITQTEVDAGKVDNTATASGTAPSASSPTVSAPSSTSTPLPAVPAITVAKSAGAPTGATAGSTISYTFTVTNSGNVTLSGVAISDTQLDAAATCAASTLAPGASTTCTGTHTITQTEVDAGKVDNTATASGTAPGASSPTVSAPSSTSTPLTAAPAVTVDKSAGTPTGATAGSTIPYTFTVTNSGNVTLSGVAISDTQLDAAATCAASTLAPGVSTTCTGTHTITQTEVDAGKVDNTATASGTAPGASSPTVSAPASTSTPIASAPAITVTKTADRSTYSALSEVITYRYVITNTGNVTISNLTLADDILGSITNCSPTQLKPAETAQCSATHTVILQDLEKGTITNVATASGTPSQGTLQPATATATVTKKNNPIAARDDNYDAVDGQVGVPQLGNALNNDTQGSGPATLDTVEMQVLTPATSPTGDVVPQLDVRTGIVSVPAGTPAGEYRIEYRICERTNPTNCADAVITVPVTAPQIKAIDDVSPQPLDGAIGGTMPSVLGNDELNGTRPTLETVTVTPGTSPASGVTMNTDGTITIAPGTAPGTYVYPYTICDRINPSNCDSATATVTIIAQPPLATDNAAETEPNTPVTLPVMSDDNGSGYPLDPTSIQLVNPPAGATLSVDGKTITVPGEGTWVANDDGTVTFTPIPGFSGEATPIQYTVANIYGTTSNAATLRVVIRGTAAMRITKSAVPRDVKIGDLIRYTVTIENIGAIDIHDAMLVDTPPAGFNLVADSIRVSDDNSAGRIAGTSPIRVDQIDVRLGGRATITYLLRVGAGVRAGIHRNRAEMFDDGKSASNVATADVRLVSDPLFDTSLIVGTVWNDINANGFQDEGERGIPGVRIASVEGLLMETDQFGRYHLEGVDAGKFERGTNFILKLDPATLPPGSKLTTDNPLLRRITPGLPVRFDFGVQLPEGSVRKAGTRIETKPNEVAVVSGTEILGTVLFDTDKAQIRPEFNALLDRIAAQLAATGGTVEVTGHTDVRASADYNQRLGMRRAQAVTEALRARLPDNVKSQVQVDTVDSDAASGDKP
ncbi:DUF7507 domain-containing protein [Aquilutibacter rugosus]|uniref:DUF7507 domain-containing protein n=1 Tax=Aquilutibacter rugosus TaxID=3115820 RepID=UPI002F40CB86